eukprot:TRINITY_DN2627_c0_g1_i1.p1 TRINITY_DN2627_c0_g1~~TRINITY_DN2627_c0_g1_i1.p1  ORF type:complete len:315 (-),score=107.28 TRINITY_DN2627_c0_g1_i1:46-939(-)
MKIRSIWKSFAPLQNKIKCLSYSVDGGSIAAGVEGISKVLLWSNTGRITLLKKEEWKEENEIESVDQLLWTSSFSLKIASNKVRGHLGEVTFALTTESFSFIKPKSEISKWQLFYTSHKLILQSFSDSLVVEENPNETFNHNESFFEKQESFFLPFKLSEKKTKTSINTHPDPSSSLSLDSLSNKTLHHDSSNTDTKIKSKLMEMSEKEEKIYENTEELNSYEFTDWNDHLLFGNPLNTQQQEQHSFSISIEIPTIFIQEKLIIQSVYFSPNGERVSVLLNDLKTLLVCELFSKNDY